VPALVFSISLVVGHPRQHLQAITDGGIELFDVEAFARLDAELLQLCNNPLVSGLVDRFPLTAKFNKLTIKINRPQLSPEDIKNLEAAMKEKAKAN
jgi:hypothetical protein